MTRTKWGIIGPGTIAHNFADGMAETESGKLIAIASRSADRRDTFGDRYGIEPAKRYDDYAALCADPDVDAVYVSTPHPWHAEHAIMAMRAGKAVMCEKPAGLSAAEVTAMTEVAAQENVFFMEAYKCRLHPQIQRILDIVGSGEIGQVHHIRTQFGFAAKFNPASRLFNRDLAGGAIFDVGGYPAALARLIAGAAVGKPVDEPIEIKGTGVLGDSGVDEVAYALLKFPGGFTAEIATAITQVLDNTATITGTRGSIHMDDPWAPGRNGGPSDCTLQITVEGTTRTENIRSPKHLFAFQAEMASNAIADGLKQAVFPGMSHADSIGNNTVLDAWRRELGYRTVGEHADAGLRRLTSLIPAGAPSLPLRKIEGVSRPVSALIMGCDNRNSSAEGAIVWDAWLDAGGNAFDTGFVYGGGTHEAALGEWIGARGVADEIVVIAKGAHSPYCTPRAIETQLEISLNRLGLNSVPIYIMHRDNPAVPVDEFVDALNRLHDKGRIGIFGGSNWSVGRFREANAHAAKTGQQRMRILNNNLSLAVMEKPVWAGCVTSNNPETLDFLRTENTVHLSWSSQARGFFLPEELRNRLPKNIGPEECFGSDGNRERRRRAETLAEERGVSAHNVATAWVIGQSFPSFALIGPRSPGEIVSTLPGVDLSLTEAELAWLNLERDDR